MADLKPCPFCGGRADMVQPGTSRHSCIVECSNCGCRLECSDEGERSGESWNRRTTDCTQEVDRASPSPQSSSAAHGEGAQEDSNG